MSKGTSHFIRNLFRLRHDVPISFYLTDLFFRKIMRQNAGVKWAIHHTSTVHSPEKILRGKGVYPGDSPNVYINAKSGISIGDYTNIGPNVGLVSSNHDFINNEVHTITAPIVIGKHCWLGMGAVVLPEVVLGDFTIVGAGAIVTRSFEEGYCVLAGNPARVIKQLNRSDCETFAQTKN
jgi:acetyltransferase-like isoleucine patch superfamily enzyme